ncbi:MULTISPECIES: DMT family transporter [unclassified Micromonospora]|uniref:DMT family transporter n=1 Tax=unclassified Micromonospora TaxID=2617518 RepID=UPI000EF4510E|nr:MULTISPECIES: DMT family transporter [unclassified Micromonospora]RLP93881.1 DMT family transporter [Micromonospora sp. BL4]RLP94841.1 DMT family transporter [Micromonospora sp. CV4]
MPPSSHRPPLDPLTTGAVGLAVVAVSSSAPLIAYAAAPALAIAFWRNLLAVAVLSPFSLARRRAEFRALAGRAGRREGLYCVLSGVALAAHFATWMPSAQLTSVATATALVATQPVWQGLIARAQGRGLPTVVWIGIAVAVGGAVIATGADVGISGRAVLGDLLALTGGLFAAIYTAFGERARASISTTTYTTICYGICALILLVVCLLGGVRLTGFDGRTWLAILALVAGAQLLGHSMFNYALQKIPATTVSVLILLEVPGAALLGWVWLGQLPRPYALLGMGLLLVGVAVVVLGGARVGRRATPPPTPLPADAAPLKD